MITTVDEFVRAAGGNKSLAAYFNVEPNAISMWKEREVIPSRHILKAQALALANGLTLAPQIFIPRMKPRKARKAA